MTAPTTRETADHIGEANEKVTADHAELAEAHYIDLFRTIREAGRSDSEKANAASKYLASILLSEIAALRGERDEWRNWYRKASVEINDQTDRATQAERQRDELRKALEPFAKAAGKLDGLWSEDDWRWNDSVRSCVTVRDIRRASKALANQGADQ